MNSIRPAIQRVTVAAMRRAQSTATVPTQGVHNLSPQTAVPVRLSCSLSLSLSLAPQVWSTHSLWFFSLASSAVFILLFVVFDCVLQPQLRRNMARGFQANWLSDPSTYPIIVIMGCALTFMTGMGLHALAYYKDVRVNPDRKHTEIQTWGNDRVASIVEVVGNKNPYYRPTFTEGLGVNHDEWVKAKAAATEKL